MNEYRCKLVCSVGNPKYNCGFTSDPKYNCGFTSLDKTHIKTQRYNGCNATVDDIFISMSVEEERGWKTKW